MKERSSAGQLWALWTSSYALAWGVGWYFRIEYSSNVGGLGSAIAFSLIPGAIEGAIAGFILWVALKSYKIGVRWVIFSVGSWTLAWATVSLGIVIGVLFGAMTSFSGGGPSSSFQVLGPFAALAGAAGGTIIGVGQWWASKSSDLSVRWLVPVSTLAWGIGWLAIMAFWSDQVLDGFQGLVFATPASPWLTGAMAGAIVGTISGGFLVGAFRRERGRAASL